ncbi:hypothetical protein RA11412_2735 [Rothia aeria]|uniref:Uncharacterized protein n=2 Tax=Rothia aeria TaxID=172042 RepID=A0A2Z5R372_9MICC|nr:hypothetical protein RA11412_2735 [Rothia aeria]
MFYEGSSWSIVFRESPLPIAEPYGILINFCDSKIIGFEDISGSEEI